MVITYAEKSQFSRNAESIAVELVHRLSNFDNSVLLFKVLAHALKNNDFMMERFDEAVFEDEAAFSAMYVALLEHALEQAVHASSMVSISKDLVSAASSFSAEYSPRELATYFGVSVTTIFNWIDQDRFMGVTRAGSNRHNRIPDDTVYISGSGKKLLVRDVVVMWERQEAERNAAPKENDLTYYNRQIDQYEEKYKGKFERTLGAQANRTPEEETDAQVWKYLLGRQKFGFGDSEK